jgi:hypothetical protein
MAEIHDTGPITPREKKMFEQEYKHGAALFQKALDQCAKSHNPYQQEQFGEVMHKAMQVLNQAAKELKRKDLMEQNKQIAQDYKAYQDHPTGSAKDKLNQDLDKAKKAIG